MTIFADHLARRRAGAHAPQILQTVWGYRERRARRWSSITSSTHKKWRHSEKPAEDKLYDARSSLRRKGSGSDQYPTAITEDQAGSSVGPLPCCPIDSLRLTRPAKVETSANDCVFREQPHLTGDPAVVTSYGPNIASADHCANPPSAAGASHRALTIGLGPSI
jgi:hypothetical protein